ncbi:MAG: FHA domain-containing protein [Pyrinomonadaceae bacterium]
MTIKIVVNNQNLNPTSQSETFTLEDLLISIGSGNEANVRLLGEGIASEQVVIVNESGKPLLINQAKGTIFNGEELDQGFPKELKHNDRIQIGSYRLIIEFNENSLVEDDEKSSNEQSFAVINNGNNGSKSYPENAFENFSPPAQSAETSSTPIDNRKFEVATFADILSSLRKEEDQFYFQVTEADGAKRRLLIESDEIVLGWAATNDFFSTDQEVNIDLPQAVIRKDWNGVTIYPNGNEAILLNEALLEVGSRLKNGDKLVFSRRLLEAGTRSVTLVFCEPAALVELNAILPQQLLSNALETNHSGEITVEAGSRKQLETENYQATAVETAQLPPTKIKSPFYFGYFTPLEIIIMIVATILTAALTYILLDFS